MITLVTFLTVLNGIAVKTQFLCIEWLSLNNRVHFFDGEFSKFLRRASELL